VWLRVFPNPRKCPPGCSWPGNRVSPKLEDWNGRRKSCLSASLLGSFDPPHCLVRAAAGGIGRVEDFRGWVGGCGAHAQSMAHDVKGQRQQ